MNKDLNKAFPIVAAALGKKMGVKVVVTGTKAETDGSTIFLPAYIQEDQNYMDVAWGFLAHESAHIRWTDFHQFEAIKSQHFRKHVLNVIEDGRIENALGREYPGTKMALNAIVRVIVASDNYPLSELNGEEVKPVVAFERFLFFYMRGQYLHQGELTNHYEKATECFKRTFSEGIYVKMLALLSNMDRLNCTADALLLTDRIIEMLEEEEKQNQPQTPQSPAPNANDRDGSDDQSQPGQAGSEQSTAGSDSCGDESTVRQVLDAGEGDFSLDLGDAAKDYLENQDESAYGNYYFPQSGNPERNNIGDDLIQKVASETGKLRSALVGAVQSCAQVRVVATECGKRLLPSKLHRLALSDTRIYRKQTNVKRPNTAIHILLDTSRSMSYDRLIDVANEATLALLLSLKAIKGVNPALTAFPYGVDGDEVNAIVKHRASVRQAAHYLPEDGDGGTPLASALWYAASEVLAAPEVRKIIMVLTDGEPDSQEQAQEMIARCKASNIEMVGIGIKYNLHHLFDNGFVISQLGDLRDQLFRISSDLLVA